MNIKFKIYTDYYGRGFTMNNEVEPEVFAMQVSDEEYALLQNSDESASEEVKNILDKVLERYISDEIEFYCKHQDEFNRLVVNANYFSERDSVEKEEYTVNEIAQYIRGSKHWLEIDRD